MADKDNKPIKIVSMTDKNAIKAAAMIELLHTSGQAHGILSVVHCSDNEFKLFLAGSFEDRPQLALMPLKRLEEKVRKMINDMTEYTDIPIE